VVEGENIGKAEEGEGDEGEKGGAAGPRWDDRSTTADRTVTLAWQRQMHHRDDGRRLRGGTRERSTPKGDGRKMEASRDGAMGRDSVGEGG